MWETVKRMVSQFQVPTPKSFSFKYPERVAKMDKRFKRYHLASSLNKKSSEVQVNALIYDMEDLADDIVLSFGISDKKPKLKVIS